MIKTIGAGAAAAAAVGAGVAGRLAMAGQTSTPQPPAVPHPPPPGPRRRSIRIAHLTDIHVQPEKRADQGLTACLRHVQNLPDRPELILTGGDAVFDSFEADNERTQLLWDLWRKTLKQECSIPLEHCIGNHDIWGGNKRKSGTTGDEPNYGKKRAIEMLELPDRYRSFDRNGWHFIVLDSTQPQGDGYKAYLDEQQFQWLADDLKSTKPNTPALVLSHIPICTATVFMGAADAKREDWTISGGRMHLDALRLKSLFNQYPNVKLCISGHMHLVDRVDYNGVTYLCNGAVSGNWWKGRHKECSEGYAIIDLYDDGGFERQYVQYGWQAQE
jgi:Icc protein